MKKVIVTTVIILGSLSVHAIPQFYKVLPQNVVYEQTEYTEVSTETIPAPVKTALEAAYPGAKLEKAFVNEKKEYKLQISVGDQRAFVYTDVNGNWLKI